MHRPTLVVAIVLLQTRAFQRPPRHVQRLAPVRAAAADDVNSLMTQLNAAVQAEDFRKSFQAHEGTATLQFKPVRREVSNELGEV